MTLTEFLQARIAEDAAAGEWVASQHGPDSLSDYTVAMWDIESNPGITVGDGRWAAECEAKRRIVANYEEADENGVDAAWEACAAIAAIYTDHPDYRQEWKL